MVGGAATAATAGGAAGGAAVGAARSRNAKYAGFTLTIVHPFPSVPGSMPSDPDASSGCLSCSGCLSALFPPLSPFKEVEQAPPPTAAASSASATDSMTDAPATATAAASTTATAPPAKRLRPVFADRTYNSRVLTELQELLTVAEDAVDWLDEDSPNSSPAVAVTPSRLRSALSRVENGALNFTVALAAARETETIGP